MATYPNTGINGPLPGDPSPLTGYGGSGDARRNEPNGQLSSSLQQLQDAINSGNQKQYDLALAQLMGYFQGQPTLATGEALGTIGGQPTVAEQQLTGYSGGGQPLLSTQEALGAIGGLPTEAAKAQDAAESGWYNAPTGRYQTQNGAMTIDQMRQDMAAQLAAGKEPGLRDPTNPGAWVTPASLRSMSDADILRLYAGGAQGPGQHAALSQVTTPVMTQAAQKQYGDLASGLMDTATKLKGPADYAQFEQYTGAGRDLLSQLFGATRPAFSVPSQPLQPETMNTLLAQLGLNGPASSAPGSQPGGGGTDLGSIVGGDDLSKGQNPFLGDPTGLYTLPGQDKPLSLDDLRSQMDTWDTTSSSPTDQNALDFISQTRPDIGAAGYSVPEWIANLASGGWSDSPAVNAAAPQGAQAVAAALNPNWYTPTTTPDPALAGMSDADLLSLYGQHYGTTPQAQRGQAALWPGQINPANWDAIGQPGQQVLLSLAQAAGWDPNEFLSELDAQRPVGRAYAPGSTGVQLAPLGSL